MEVDTKLHLLISFYLEDAFGMVIKNSIVSTTFHNDIENRREERWVVRKYAFQILNIAVNAIIMKSNAIINVGYSSDVPIVPSDYHKFCPFPPLIVIFSILVRLHFQKMSFPYYCISTLNSPQLESQKLHIKLLIFY